MSPSPLKANYCRLQSDLGDRPTANRLVKRNGARSSRLTSPSLNLSLKFKGGIL